MVTKDVPVRLRISSQLNRHYTLYHSRVLVVVVGLVMNFIIYINWYEKKYHCKGLIVISEEISFSEYIAKRVIN